MTTTEQMIIDRVPPKPRTSFWGGTWDQFVGPQATTAEIVLQLGGAFLGGALCVLAYLQENSEETKLSTIIMVSILAIDMVGGVVTNATSAAKRWYHRSGQTALHHLGFVSIHALQIGLVASMSTQPVLFFSCVYGFVMVASVIILATPLYLQRPVAMLLATCLVPICILIKDVVPTGMEWFIPILALKLLVSHLVKEAPFQPIQGSNNKKNK